jgi:hypothetical protein
VVRLRRRQVEPRAVTATIVAVKARWAVPRVKPLGPTPRGHRVAMVVAQVLQARPRWERTETNSVFVERCVYGVEPRLDPVNLRGDDSRKKSQVTAPGSSKENVT